ncbi:MAG: hypothetical protein ACXVJD_15865 [Mucilaginibacter sp.]
MNTSKNQKSSDQNIIVSFLTIRKSVGVLGITLPVILAFGVYIIGNCHLLKSSVSAYYYTIMGTYLTGTLCAVGLFLFTYKGYDLQDQIFSKIAGAFAAVTALFPTNCDHICNYCNVICKDDSKLSNTVHYIAAGIFLTSLAYMSLFLFPKSDQPKPYPKQKRRRNAVYVTCGCIMVVFLIGIPALKIPSVGDALNPYKAEFWFESIALVAFGSSWLVKGEAVLKD